MTFLRLRTTPEEIVIVCNGITRFDVKDNRIKDIRFTDTLNGKCFMGMGSSNGVIVFRCAVIAAKSCQKSLACSNKQYQLR